MKFRFLLLGLLLTALAANAQIEAGMLRLGGNFNFNRSDNNISESIDATISFAPNVGYFTSENAMVYAILPLSHSRSTADRGDFRTINNGLGFGAGYRLYFLSTDQLYLHIGPELVFQRNVNKVEQNGDEPVDVGAQRVWQGNISPGITYFLNDKLSIDAAFGGFGYQSIQTRNTGDYSVASNDFFFNFGSSISFGLYYYLGTD